MKKEDLMKDFLLSKSRESEREKKDEAQPLPAEEIKEELSLFEKFKKEYLDSEDGRDLEKLIEFEKNTGTEIFSIDEFLQIKFEHPGAKIIIVDPTREEVKLGKKQNYYIIKPMYNSEYTNFIKTVGTRDLFPEEFTLYMVKTSTVYPKLSSEQVSKMSAGNINILYSTCMQFSTFNTTYKILEV